MCLHAYNIIIIWKLEIAFPNVKIYHEIDMKFYIIIFWFTKYKPSYKHEMYIYQSSWENTREYFYQKEKKCTFILVYYLQGEQKIALLVVMEIC